MSLADCRLRQTGCGRVLRLTPRSECLFQNIAFDLRAAAGYLELSNRPVCLLQTVAYDERAAAGYLGLSTRPVCLLQTVGEPSVLSARTLRTYVPLRAKPKRKRVCKRYTGLGEKALGTLPQPRSGNTSARNTRTLAKKPWVPCRSPYPSTSARDIQGPHKEAPVTSPILTPSPASSSSISYRYEKQKEWGNYPWSAPGRCRSSLRCSLSCLRVPARPPAPRIRSYATLCG